MEKNKNQFKFNIIGQNGSEERTLEEISESGCQDKAKLGAAYGKDLGHCLYLARRHCKKFDEITSYRVSSTDDETLLKLKSRQPGSICVEFYGAIK